MKKSLLLIMFVAVLGTHRWAAAIEIEPPLSKKEVQMLEEMRRQWKASGMPAMTEEQESAMMQKTRQTQIEMMGHVAGLKMAVESGKLQQSARGTGQAESADAAATVATIESAARDSKSRLLDEYEARSASDKFAQFEPRGDGFAANDKVFIDADGTVTHFGADAATGRVTYLVDVGDGEMLVKHHNVNSDLQPLLVGRAKVDDGRVEFRSVSGETAGGNALIPSSSGVVVTRGQSMVIYTIGKGVKATAIPEGFVVTKMQNGDVGGTGFVLVERTAPQTNSVQRMGQNLGQLFGKRDNAQDYALFNMASEKLVPLYLSLQGKTVGQGTGCERQNAFVNKCTGWKTWESIWDADGRANQSHYFWALSWHATKYGPIAVANENSQREVNVIRLESGDRYNAFTRKLGVNAFKAEPTKDGGLKVVAQLAFKQGELPDIGDLLTGEPTKLQ